MNDLPAVELRAITKTFGQVVANDKIDLSIHKGEILSLLGENGSGKTTLMNMLSGIYQPDSGEIIRDGEVISIRSPRDAYTYGIGMVHQHFHLVDVFTASENIILGLDIKKLKPKLTAQNVQKICDKYGFTVDIRKKVYDMSVSEKQTVEIIKVLYRGAEVLILDEPTAVLTPQETERLFSILKNMKNDGKAVVIITHKLQEVMEVSDKVAVLRKGKYIGTLETKNTNPGELTNMMVGKQVTLDIDRPDAENKEIRLSVNGLTCFDGEGLCRLNNVSFDAFGGEILGIAGIAGSGQKELLECITGLYPAKSGEVIYHSLEGGSTNLIGLTPGKIRSLGVGLAFVPEDRLGMGLVGSMGMSGNMMLRSWNKGPGFFLDKKEGEKSANEVKERLDVSTPGIYFPVRRLSGGNIQKVLVGREIATSPRVLLTAYAVRGLDINTSYTIYSLLMKEKMNGVAVIYIGEELDVLIELCDRILVLCAGKVSGIVDARKTTKEEIGLLMTTVGGEYERAHC